MIDLCVRIVDGVFGDGYAEIIMAKGDMTLKFPLNEQ